MNDMFQKCIIGTVGSTIAVATTTTHQVLSVVASACTICFMVLSIVKIAKELIKKKDDR
tara:strand:+ start:1687 stop:1863 length:177 start_codon:yes stop_codon:yes gene_type:complete